MLIPLERVSREPSFVKSAHKPHLGTVVARPNDITATPSQPCAGFCVTKPPSTTKTSKSAVTTESKRAESSQSLEPSSPIPRSTPPKRTKSAASSPGSSCDVSVGTTASSKSSKSRSSSSKRSDRKTRSDSESVTFRLPLRQRSASSKDRVPSLSSSSRTSTTANIHHTSPATRNNSNNSSNQPAIKERDDDETGIKSFSPQDDGAAASATTHVASTQVSSLLSCDDDGSSYAPSINTNAKLQDRTKPSSSSSHHRRRELKVTAAAPADDAKPLHQPDTTADADAKNACESHNEINKSTMISSVHDDGITNNGHETARLPGNARCDNEMSNSSGEDTTSNKKHKEQDTAADNNDDNDDENRKSPSIVRQQMAKLRIARARERSQRGLLIDESSRQRSLRNLSDALSGSFARNDTETLAGTGDLTTKADGGKENSRSTSKRSVSSSSGNHKSVLAHNAKPDARAPVPILKLEEKAQQRNGQQEKAKAALEEATKKLVLMRQTSIYRMEGEAPQLQQGENVGPGYATSPPKVPPLTRIASNDSDPTNVVSITQMKNTCTFTQEGRTKPAEPTVSSQPSSISLDMSSFPHQHTGDPHDLNNETDGVDGLEGLLQSSRDRYISDNPMSVLQRRGPKPKKEKKIPRVLGTLPNEEVDGIIMDMELVRKEARRAKRRSNGQKKRMFGLLGK